MSSLKNKKALVALSAAVLFGGVGAYYAYGMDGQISEQQEFGASIQKSGEQSGANAYITSDGQIKTEGDGQPPFAGSVQLDANGNYSSNPNPGTPVDNSSSGSQTTIEGEYVCLPHKNQGDFQTMECALGVKAKDGSYYSIDAKGKYDLLFGISTGDYIKVRGVVNYIKSNVYPTSGTIVVSSVSKVSADSGVSTINSFEECAAAGYPVMESYPRMCKTPDGRTFTEDVSK